MASGQRSSISTTTGISFFLHIEVTIAEILFAGIATYTTSYSLTCFIKYFFKLSAATLLLIILLISTFFLYEGASINVILNGYPCSNINFLFLGDFLKC